MLKYGPLTLDGERVAFQNFSINCEAPKLPIEGFKGSFESLFSHPYDLADNKIWALDIFELIKFSLKAKKIVNVECFFYLLIFNFFT